MITHLPFTSTVNLIWSSAELIRAKQSRLHELQQQARLRASEQEQGLGLLQDTPSNALQVWNPANPTSPIQCCVLAVVRM